MPKNYFKSKLLNINNVGQKTVSGAIEIDEELKERKMFCITLDMEF